MLVSVYIPTRNRLEFLRRAIDSVLAQTHREFELIIVDDASTDGTAAFLEQARNADPRLTFMRNESSRGAPACRNQAIDLASSDFVTGLDDDDTFEPYRLAAFLMTWRLLESSGIATSLLYSQDNWYRHDQLIYTTQKKGTVAYVDMAAQNQVGNQVFAPRQMFLNAGLFDESMPAWQDIDLFIRILRQFGTGRLVDVASYGFDVSPRSDRISAHSTRVKYASRLVSRRYFPENGRSAQLIALQVFSEYYGFRPTIADFREFMRHGMWPLGFAKLVVARLKV